MSSTTFLAQSMGFFLFIIGLATLLNGKQYAKISKGIQDNDMLYFLMGFIMLGLGVSLVIVHNVWDASWAVVITIVCWLVFIKGILNILFPVVAKTISKPYVESMSVLYIVGLIHLIVGGFLFYMGFFHV
jgi:uncharacterized protein YjeT (DUF2065 family)